MQIETDIIENPVKTQNAMHIEVQNLSFGYSPDRKILNNITLSIEESKTLAIVGVSGCGKSTFLRLLCGIIQKQKNNLLEGSIRINGVLPDEYTKQGNVGFMFQEPTLLPNLTVLENVELPLNIKKVKNATEQARELLSLVGLTQFENYLPKQLSGGMKTRVALARTFITKPKLLLLDEPFGALDISWKLKLYRELNTLREKFNTTIVIVTHDVEEAVSNSNHIVAFGRAGKILSEIVLAEVRHEVELSELISAQIKFSPALPIGYKQDDSTITSTHELKRFIQTLIIEDN